MEFEIYEYSLCGHYLSALINGDTSGLDESEETELSEFESDVTVKLGNGHWDVIDEEGSFARDDISGLMADCYTCNYCVPVSKN